MIPLPCLYSHYYSSYPLLPSTTLLWIIIFYHILGLIAFSFPVFFSFLFFFVILCFLFCTSFFPPWVLFVSHLLQAVFFPFISSSTFNVLQNGFCCLLFLCIKPNDCRTTFVSAFLMLSYSSSTLSICLYVLSSFSNLFLYTSFMLGSDNKYILYLSFSIKYLVVIVYNILR